MRFKKLKTIKDKISNKLSELWENYVEMCKEYPPYFTFPIFLHSHFTYYDYMMMFEERRRRETYGKDIDSRNR